MAFTNNAIYASSSFPRRIKTFYGSSIGQKLVMAISGLMIIGFVLAHLAGNLQIFIGPKAFNDYAAFLKSLGGVLWLARGVILLVLILHVVTAVKLRSRNTTARKIPYREMITVQASSASLFMFETGVVIFLFILLHLAHFTFGFLQPEFHIHDSLGRDDVYFMVVSGFQNPAYVLIYCFAMLALGFHLRHAFWSMFQTLGAYRPDIAPMLQKAALILGIATALLYMSIPIAIYAGCIGL